MAKSRYIDTICISAVMIAILIIGAFGMEYSNAGKMRALGYENRIFDTSKVHNINIAMEDWDNFIKNGSSKKYANCDLTIDGEKFSNVAIRTKGGSSLDEVVSLKSNRYSFKIEFDHNEKGKTYYGLDKLCLNNVIQDNTYMKDYLVYRMMDEYGVKSPLCSFTYITVNGEEFGLYLAVEGLEDGFLRRSYGTDHGKFYKPGGGGKEEDLHGAELTEGMDNVDSGNWENIDWENMTEEEVTKLFGEDAAYFLNNGEVEADTCLQYLGDDAEKYYNIFGCAKTKITNADKKRLIASIKKINENTGIEDAVDVEAVIRYFVIHNFVGNGDSYTGSMVHNYYLYEKDGKMSMIPWDYNLAFGTLQDQTAGEVINQSIDNPIYQGKLSDRPMFAWIVNNENYKKMYHTYYKDFISRFMASGRVKTEITKTMELIAPYVKKDPTKFCTYEQFKKGVEVLQAYLELRTESIENQLAGNTGRIDASQLNIQDMGVQMTDGDNQD